MFILVIPMISSSEDYDELLVKVSAMALLTVALVWLPEAIGAAAHLVTITLSAKPDEMSGGPTQTWLENVRTQLISSSVGKMSAFGVLIFLSRWMFGFPPIIRRALARTRHSTTGQSVDAAILPP